MRLFSCNIQEPSRVIPALSLVKMREILIVTIIISCVVFPTSSHSSEEDEEVVLFRKSGTLSPSTFITQSSHATEMKSKQCNYDKISANSFTSISPLKKIEIDRTTIGELSQGAFNGCNNLKEIVIRNSKIDNLSPKVFNNLINVKKLKIKTTKIGDLKTNMFSGCSSMEEFVCEECGIENVEADSMNGLNNSRESNLQKNAIKKFSFSKIPVMANLKNLNLGNNPSHDLDITDIKSKCPNLKSLNVKGVNLSPNVKQQSESLDIAVKKN